MASLVSPEFEKYIAQQTANHRTVEFDEFIFANIPNLTADNLNEYLTIPENSLIVHRQSVSKAGVINENAVVYSVTMGTEIGDFDFNFVGLINKATNKLMVAVQTDPIKKIRNRNNIQGNSLTRSILLEFTGAKALTGISVSAETWQIDFTVRLAGLDEKIRLTNRDLYGRAVFFDNGFLLEKVAGNNYKINAGDAYIEGVRAKLTENYDLTLNSLPCSVYVDVVHHNTVTGAYQTELKFITENKADYKDSAHYQHYVQIIADIDSNGIVTDRRLLSPLLGITPKDLDETSESTKDGKGHSHKLPFASLLKRGIVKLYSGYDSDSEELGATAKALKGLKALIDALNYNLGNYIPNSKKSNDVNSKSSDTIATSFAVNHVLEVASNAQKTGEEAAKRADTADSKAIEAKKKADIAQSTADGAVLEANRAKVSAESALSVANSKQSPSTTLEGYGIIDAVSKTDYRVWATSNGWLKLPNNLIIQWGNASTSATGQGMTALFPIPFPSECLQIVATDIDNGCGSIGVSANDRNGLIAWGRNPVNGVFANYGFRYIAVGY